MAIRWLTLPIKRWHRKHKKHTLPPYKPFTEVNFTGSAFKDQPNIYADGVPLDPPLPPVQEDLPLPEPEVAAKPKTVPKPRAKAAPKKPAVKKPKAE